jgi:hypothetical protein
MVEAPIIEPISDDSIVEGQPYEGPTPSLSQGAQPVTFLLLSGPAGMTISSSTGVVSWPNPVSEGSPHLITIQATNEAGFDTESWELTVQSIMPGVLTITPSDGFDSSGPEGGPFSPSSKDYTLENTGDASLDWTASKNADWIDLSETEGTLGAGDIVTVTVTINSVADILSAGNYSDTIIFTNITDGNENTTRDVTLIIPTEWCVSSATELQAALTAAETNSLDDVIKLVQGTYYGNFVFESSEGHSITLKGGYNGGCVGRLLEPANTILDATSLASVLHLYNTNGGDVFVEGCTVRHGEGTSYGAGMDILSYLSSGPSGMVTITNNIIAENEAEWGGGLYVTCGSDSGTAGDVIVTNNFIAGNKASQCGGAVTIESYSSGTAGMVTFTNNTVTANDAESDGGVWFMLLPLESSGTINCYNNVIWGNTANTSSADINLYIGTNTANGYNNNYSDMPGSWANGGGNINVDPRFVDPGYWDDNGTPGDPTDDIWINGDYHLRSNSPCIDKGTASAPELPATDCDGDPRIINGAPDMGADEACVLALTDESRNLIIAPSGLGFGEVIVGESCQMSLSMYNGNDIDIGITDSTDPSAPYTITSGGCSGFILSPGDTCAITVEFAPSSAGNFYDYFLITTDDPEVGTVRVDLSGQGVVE